MTGDFGPGTAKPVVVCVDDDRELLQSLKRLLRSEPYDLFLTDRPQQVIEWINNRPIDLVLADQRMPEMDGVSLLRSVQEASPSTACMIMSGFPDSALALAESGVDVEGLISKPWDNEALKNTVRRVLKGRSEQEPSTRQAADATKRKPVLIDCAAKCTREVMAEVLNACEPLGADRKTPILDLGNAELLADSLTRLLKSLARASEWFDLAVDVRDPSGYVSTFFEALRAPQKGSKRP